MATKKPAVGDAALFYGRHLAIGALIERDNGVVLAVVEDPADAAAAREARAKVAELREQQLTLKGDAHAAIAKQIEAVAPKTAILQVRLRADLLSWWDAREAWVSDGRILSDEQRKVAKDLGMKPGPKNERLILPLLESAK